MSAALAKPERFVPGWSRALAFTAALALHGLAVFAFLRPAAPPLASDAAIEVSVEPEIAAVAPAAPGPWPVAPTPTDAAPPAPQPSPVSSPAPTPEPLQPALPQAPPVAAVSPDRPKAPAPAAEPLPVPTETPPPTRAPIVAAPKPPAPRPSPRALAPKPSPSPERAVRAKQTPASETEPGRRPANPGEDAGVRRPAPNAAAGAPAISGAAYGALVSAEIARHKFYPPAARAAGLSGNVGVMVTIGASGRIVSHAIVRSSGHPELDGAVAAILSAVQAPPPPGGVFRASLTLHFAIE